MAEATVAVLKGEIARLEKELDLHRRALQILEGQRSGGTAQAVRPPAPPKQAPKRVAAQGQKSKPAAKPAATGGQNGQPSTRMLIQGFLATRAPQMLTPSEIAQGLSQQGHKVDRDNIQRRLSDLIKNRAITRKEGRYGIAKSS